MAWPNPPLPPQRYTVNDCEPDTCLIMCNDGAEGFISGHSMHTTLRSLIPSLSRHLHNGY